MASYNDSNRKLRIRERRNYTDPKNLDDEIEGKRTFDLEEKLESDVYDAEFVREMKGEDITVRYFQEHGFNTPMVVYDKTGLSMKVPSSDFTIEDVKKGVGSRRTIDVMDVTTQQAMTMSMRDWSKYYNSTERDRVLNVLSLEFSHSRLQGFVQQPNIVKQIDWVDTAWPRYLKQRQKETTNVMDKMHYPKVQKYCLMSVAGCYTDFHIDMGGTSVWYHILRGAKTFWLIPPTEENLTLYERWTLSMKQGDQFFGDMVRDCQRITLRPGWTFFIPTGWIHAVHTPEDSLVFGGNFLHSFGTDMQLRIWAMENTTHVPMKFRYPFFTEIHWYVLERYIAELTGKSHITKPKAETKDDAQKSNNEDKNEETKKADLELKHGLAANRAKVIEDLRDCAERAHCETGACDSDNTAFPVLEAFESASQSSDSSEYIRKSEELLDSNENKGSIQLDIGDELDIISGKVAPKTSPENEANIFEKLNQCSLRGDEETNKVVTVTKEEMNSIRKIVEFLENLPEGKRCVPKDIPHPDDLLRDAKAMLEEQGIHVKEKCITGKYLLQREPAKKKKVPTATLR